jgi:hypothetical protein
VWKKVGDLGRTEAMCQYVSAVTDYDPDWEEKVINYNIT